MRIRFVCCVVAFIVALPEILAADAYIVRFRGFVPLPEPCNVLNWRDSASFFNTNAAPVEIRILEMSNGPVAFPSPTAFTIPPRTAVLFGDVFRQGEWAPAGGGVWTLHLDVPAGVILQDHDDIGLTNICTVPSGRVISLGRVPMPVFKRLVPENGPQVHLGTDLGTFGSRVNVIVYNSALVAATAHVELRRTCDGSLVDSRSALIPPQSTVQLPSMSTGQDSCGASSSLQGWSRYTVVSVDQPSLSLVSNVRENGTAMVTQGVPAVDLSVAQVTTF